MNMKPIIPFAIDGWTKRDVTAAATSISATTPSRSDQGARLKNSHQPITARPNAKPPITAVPPCDGQTSGISQSSHWSATATTPGQSRREGR